ncbi:MAG TPA: glycogen-binding domain-containing protein [Candidatus Limnocylindria bacterium]|nr:glycogen-binding domain-containing protein [Candidatus Limnocylindria bacterium]
MTHHRHYDQAGSDRPYSLPVHFEFTDAVASSVYIAGTFNNWQPDAKPMHPVGNGRWVREIVLPIGTFEYCLVVDGKFRPDPRVIETVPNRFGGRNSILKVMSAPEPADIFTQELLQKNWRNK